MLAVSAASSSPWCSRGSSDSTSQLDAAFDEVERQQRYYRAVADNVSDSYVVLSPAGIVLDVAGVLPQVVDDVTRVIGGDVLTVVHPDDRAIARALLDDVSCTRRPR